MPPVHAAPVFIAVILLGAGCDPLVVRPGADFAVDVAATTPIVAEGAIAVPLHFAVRGCTSFDASVRARGETHPVACVSRGEGNFEASVPLVWLRAAERCSADANAPELVQAELFITCRDAQRSSSAAFSVSYAAATRTNAVPADLPQGTVQHLAQGADPLTPYALNISVLGKEARINPADVIPGPLPLSIDGVIYLSNPLARPRLAVGASTSFFTSGCDPAGSCLDVAVTTTTSTPGEALSAWTNGNGLTTWTVWVPSTVLDLAFAADGTLVVLSERFSAAGPSATVVTRVEPREGGAVTVIGYFANERAQTRFSRAADGALAFASFVGPADGSVRTVLHTTDGAVVTTDSNPTGSLDVGPAMILNGRDFRSLQLAPDAALLLVNGTSVGAPGASFSSLPTGAYPGDGDRGGAAWLTDAVAMWQGTSLLAGTTWGVFQPMVEAFDVSPPHARKYEYTIERLDGASIWPTLYGGTAIGDKLVLTTSSGVRVLDSNGILVGGSDPLPCALTPTSVAVQTGPTSFAVAAGTYVFVFDLARMTPPN